MPDLTRNQIFSADQVSAERSFMAVFALSRINFCAKSSSVYHFTTMENEDFRQIFANF
jgi:hypothetical protein